LTGTAASWLWGGPGYYYTNPFYVPTSYVQVVPALNYSQPILDPLAAQQAADAGETPPEPNIPQSAVKKFDAARDAFKNLNYQMALANVDDALKEVPDDAVLHEFRALVLFAQGKYKDAAAGVYAVLAVGPGWDWQTMRSLYPNTDTYTKQLRALEAYLKENPDSADARFLLAYHYITMGYPDAAAKQLERVTKLLPDDKLSKALLDAIRNPPKEEEAPNPQQ
jgi:tetratricopeptide (TPR) repeat protein